MERSTLEIPYNERVATVVGGKGQLGEKTVVALYRGINGFLTLEPSKMECCGVKRSLPSCNIEAICLSSTAKNMSVDSRRRSLNGSPFSHIFTSLKPREYKATTVFSPSC